MLQEKEKSSNLQLPSPIMITKPIQNLTAVFTTFLLLVLPKLKEHVSTSLKSYFYILKQNPYNVRQANHKKPLSKRLSNDPKKITTTFRFLPNQKTIPDQNELAKLYLSPQQQKDFDTIENCKFSLKPIKKLINKFSKKNIVKKTTKTEYFGKGQSFKIFKKILKMNNFWKIKSQKEFQDL